MEDLIFNKISYNIEKYKDFLLDEIEDQKELLKQYVYKKNNEEFVWPYHGEYSTVRLEDTKECKILRYVEKEFNDLYHINSKGRYYVLPPNYELTPHNDVGTKCGFNFVLKGSSPIVFHKGDWPGPLINKTYFDEVNKKPNYDNYPVLYKQKYIKALLNLQKIHSVPKSKTSRIIIKFSIFDESFEAVKNKIEKYNDTRN